MARFTATATHYDQVADLRCHRRSTMYTKNQPGDYKSIGELQEKAIMYEKVAQNADLHQRGSNVVS